MNQENKIPAPPVNDGADVKQPSAAKDVKDSSKRIKEAIAAKKLKKEKQKKIVDEKIPVVATDKGTYRNTRRKKGDKFTIKCEKHFSSEWMELLT